MQKFKKIVLMIAILLLPTVCGATKIIINDKHNLINEKYIIFNDEKELKQELDRVLKLMLLKGYATSTITFEKDELVVIPGMVDKIILDDNSTFFPNIKKYLFGMNLENKVLNIVDIDKIVSRYNSRNSNKIKVSIEDSTKDNYSNIIIKNDYSFKVTPQVSVKSSRNLITKKDSFSMDFGLSFEQILGFNDSLNLGYSPKHNSRKYTARYNLPIKDLSLGFNYELAKDTDGEYFKSKIQKVSVDANFLIVNKPTANLSINGSAYKEVKKQYLKNTLVVKDYLEQLQMGFDLIKYIVKNQNIYTIQVRPNISHIKKRYTKSDLKKLSCTKRDINVNFFSSIYTLNAFAGESEAKNKKNIFDNDCKYSNDISEFDNPPLKFNTSKIIYVNNTFKVPPKQTEMKVYPFTEFAAGRDLEKNKNIMGGSAGLMLNKKNLDFGAKYSRTNDDEAFSLKLNLLY